jgi:2-polyprenyl-6-methoxyphenol hydroxylase-like FAD-dependent oxidoreductase
MKILVIGAGIGGRTTAAALGQAGHDVRLVEVKPDMESSVLGVGVIQPSNALRALDAIGCAEACMDVGYSSSRPTRLLDEDGKVVMESPALAVPGGRFPAFNGITRPNLHSILGDRLGEVGVEIEYGSTFTEIEQEDDAAEVTFDDGSKDSFDLVVGADGVRSAVRKTVFGEEIQPRWNGLGSFRSNIPRVIEGEIEIDRPLRQRAGKRDVGFAPIGADVAYIFFNCPWDAADRLNDAEAAQVMRDFMKPFGGITARVRDEFIQPSEVLFRPMELLITPLPWHRGRVVLTGDALHAVTPHLGQGAALAVEDGIVLADVLGSGDSLEADLTEFGERRFERCNLVVDSCAKISEWELHPTKKTRADTPVLHRSVTERMMEPI